MKVNTRVTGIVLVTTGAVALLAGCGPLTTSAATTPDTTTVTETQPAAEEPADEPAGDAESAAPADDDLVPCTADVLEPEMGAGELPAEQEYWNSEIYVTNVGDTDCRLDGPSNVVFYADTDVPIDRGQTQPEGDGPDGDLVIVGPGERAELGIHYGTAPADTASAHCPSPTFARFIISGDSQEMEVGPADGAAAMPPLCGEEIQVSPWAASV